MSVNRGVFQGRKELKSLSVTYQTEMISRLCRTCLILAFLQVLDASLVIAIGIFCSFIFGLFPFKRSHISFRETFVLEDHYGSQIKRFFLLTAFFIGNGF